MPDSFIKFLRAGLLAIAIEIPEGNGGAYPVYSGKGYRCRFAEKSEQYRELQLMIDIGMTAIENFGCAAMFYFSVTRGREDMRYSKRPVCGLTRIFRLEITLHR